ncbi:hypothetical protein C8F01DRAFT_1356429 [Mycena amicta]|nr:hypothetical protein C8F01DRAFT_1356429 [Mycena amicta]
MTQPCGFACSFLGSEFVNVERRSFDADLRREVFSAQRRARATAGTTEERRVAEAVAAIRSKTCTAINAHGAVCTGVPIIKENRGQFGGKWRVDCSGRSIDFNAGHLAHSIDVDQDLFLRAFNSMAMANDTSRDTDSCGGILHPTSGLKPRKSLPHTHIINGVSREGIVVNYPCDAQRTILVPLDPSIRKAMVLHKAHFPHSHILPAFTKKTYQVTTMYEDCVNAAGSTGATPAKVDNASSTSLLLNGKTPAQFAPALQSKVLKNKIVRDVKKKAFPMGLGVEGALYLHRQDAERPPGERYVHRFVMMGSNGTIILTAVPGLLKLLDDKAVNSFEADTTFKHVAGELNEWEVATFYKPLNRALTITRAYVDRASTDFFEHVFDEFTSLKRELTGKPISFKALVPDGNILAFNSDMESAQVLGASRSLLKTNVPSYSGIPADTTAHAFAPRVIKLCDTHSKRAILDFKSLVSTQDFQRLLKFSEVITSPETLAEFSEFVRGLGVKKIQDWWDHKEMSDWILPCLVKLLSPMPADDWDATPSTTNTGEAQHHWTNTQTGTKLPLVEAIETARRVDLRVWAEVELTMESGVLTNPYNEVTHRLARSMTRHATTARKYREAHVQAEAATELEDELEAAKQAQKEAAERIKELRAQKAAGKTSGKGKKKAQTLAGDSSSGRVKSRAKASTNALKTANDAATVSPVVHTPAPAVPAPAPFPELFTGYMPEFDPAYVALPFMSDDLYFNDGASTSTFPTLFDNSDVLYAQPGASTSTFPAVFDDSDAIYAEFFPSASSSDVHMPDAYTGDTVAPSFDPFFVPTSFWLDNPAPQPQQQYLQVPRPSPSPPPLPIEVPVTAPGPARKRKAEVDVSLILSPRVTRQRRIPPRADTGL